ncbi:MAG: carboxylate--amine ligase [Anaerolineae bacterium]|nr:carboxylate--amine ligase [Anaerolineae bacterium]
MQSSSWGNQQPYAIVIGLDCLQGLQTARILAHRQVPVIAIAKDPKHHSCRTRVCEKILFADTGDEDLVEKLEILGPKFNQKAVLIPCQDKNVLVISRHRQRLEPWYHIVLPRPEVVEMMMDKVSFYSYARENGFPVPLMFFLYCKRDAEQAATQLVYPCILKPPFRLRTWSKYTKLKGLVANSPDEFLAQYERCCKWSEVLIVQKLIEGPDVNHYTCNCYFDSRGEPIVTFTSRKLRQWQPQTGQACLAEEARNDIVVNETIRLFRSVNFRGLGYLELKHDEHSGEYFIIEPNIGRPTGRAAMAEAGDVELLYTMYCEVAGLPIPANRQQKYERVKWIHLLRDLQAALYHWRRGELTVKEWWLSVRGHKTYAIFSWSDPLPFLAAMFRAITVIRSAKEQKTHLWTLNVFKFKNGGLPTPEQSPDRCGEYLK